MASNKKIKVLYSGTVNGENSWFKKSADTYIYSTTPNNAAFGLFKRYMKKLGRAEVTEIFKIDKENNRADKVMFQKSW